MAKALVIDDSKTDRRLISEILRSLGIQSIEVEDGEKAYSTLVSRPEIELVLVDWGMPVLNGIDFIRRVRSDERFSRLNLIMVTGATEMSEIETALAAGVDEYLMKPIDRDMVREKLALIGISRSVAN